MNATTVLLAATETVTFVLGALITLLADRAFSRRQEPALGALVLGFGLVTLGSVVSGALYHVGDVAPVLRVIGVPVYQVDRTGSCGRSGTDVQQSLRE